MELFPWQASGLKSALEHDAVALYWQMRLGKTLVAIRWANQKVRWANPKTRNGFILVVCPLSVIETWEEHLARENYPCIALRGTPTKRLELVQANAETVKWFLINPEGLLDRSGNQDSAVASLSWDCVIVDESQSIRSPKAKVTRCVNRRLINAPYRMLLSGTPNPESTLDYYEQMRFLSGGAWLGCANFWDFRFRFFKPVPFGLPGEFVPKKDTRELVKQELKKHCLFLRRKEVGFQVEKVYERRYVDAPKSIRQQMETLEREFCIETKETKYAPVKRLWLQRLAGGFFEDEETGIAIASNHKLKELQYLVATELQEERVVVFFRFNQELHKAYDALTKAGISVCRIHGGCNPAVRKEKRLSFQKKKYRVALCQTRCIKTGLDFSVADTVIYYSNWDESEYREQSEERVVSPNKKKNLILIIDLITRDSVDEDIYWLLREKKLNAASMRLKMRSRLEQRSGK